MLPTYIRININDWALLKKLCNIKVNWKIFERKSWPKFVYLQWITQLRPTQFQSADYRAVYKQKDT